MIKISIIKIGNSKGIIIPKQYIKKLGDPGEIEIEPSDDGLYIKPTEDITQKDWEEKFSDAINQGQEP